MSVIEQHRELAVAVVERQVAALTKPQVPMAAFLARLLGRAPKTAEALADSLRD